MPKREPTHEEQVELHKVWVERRLVASSGNFSWTVISNYSSRLPEQNFPFLEYEAVVQAASKLENAILKVEGFYPARTAKSGPEAVRVGTITNGTILLDNDGEMLVAYCERQLKKANTLHVPTEDQSLEVGVDLV